MKYITLVIILFASVCAQAQIGYQFSVLDTSTGEPRVNEKVSVTVEITDNAGTSIFSSTQSATTDLFGVVSLTIGNASTFANVDWSKLPLYVSAKIDGTLLSKSQILSVPVAEYAKKTGILTPEKLGGMTVRIGESTTFLFNKNGSVIHEYYDEESGENVSIQRVYEIDGNSVYIYHNFKCLHFRYSPNLNSLYQIDDYL